MDNSIRLVRTQDDFYGMKSDAEGNIILHKAQPTNPLSKRNNRNTAHFSINGVVTDHAYGTFDGQITMVCDPKQMSIPSGFRQEDVWFAFDKNRDLNIGKAKVFAPIGVEPPEGVAVTFFDATIPMERERVVNEYLKTLEITPRKVGMWGWESNGMLEQENWIKETTTQLYGASAELIQKEIHDASMDKSLENGMITCINKLAKAHDQYYFQSSSGHDLVYTDVINSIMNTIKEDMAKFKRTMHPETVKNSEGYFEYINDNLEKFEEEIKEIKEKFNKPYFLKLSQSSKEFGPFNEEECKEKIQKFGYSDTYYVKNIKSEDGYQPIGLMFTASECKEQSTWDMNGSVPPPLPKSDMTSYMGAMPPPLPKEDLSNQMSLPLLPTSGIVYTGAMPPPLPQEETSFLPTKLESLARITEIRPAETERSKIKQQLKH